MFLFELFQFHDFLKKSYNPENKYQALFFITAKERAIYFDEDTHQIVNTSPCTVDSAQSIGYYQCYTHQLGDFNINRNILAIQQLCKIYNIRDFWIPGWQLLDLWPSVNRTKFFNGGRPITILFSEDGEFYTLTELLNSKNKYFTKCGHPNQQGHQVIADTLANHIIDKFQ